jgi:predicted acetyltransferase
VYTLRAGRVGHASRPQEVKIRDFAWLDMDACKSLWQFFAKHDLVGRVSWANAPVDDPAHSLMAEPRMLHTKDSDGTWWRIVDAAAALAQRGYGHTERLVLGIAGDDLAPWNNGTWQLETSGSLADEAQVNAVSDAPDVELSVRALAGLYSGMYSARTLANWGQLSGSEQGIAVADRLFSTTFAPHCPDHY